MDPALTQAVAEQLAEAVDTEHSGKVTVMEVKFAFPPGVRAGGICLPALCLFGLDFTVSS